jgi:plastocyanin
VWRVRTKISSAVSATELESAYFPSVIRVHAGDTVVFHQAGTGEPHTVALCSLVDNAVSTSAGRTPAQQNNPPKAALAADAAVPQLLAQGPRRRDPGRLEPVGT